MADAKCKPQALADALGLSYQAVKKVLDGKTTSFTAINNDRAAEFLKVSSGWLAHGGGPKKITGRSVDELADVTKDLRSPLADYQLDNIRPVENRRQVPLISWVQAGAFAEVQDNFRPGEAEHWVTPLYSKPGKRAFGLTIEGESMVNPHPPPAISFPPGTVILVDPDVGYDPGSYVVAKDVMTQRATFKQLITDSGRWYLKPLNPAFPTIEIDDPSVRVIATAIEFQPPGGKLR
jgi:SOS-response transcriptional repressor LexA